MQKSEKNIYQRMSDVMNEVGAIEKKGWNDYSKYSYVRAVDVFNELQKLLVKNGILLSITEESCERQQYNEKNFHSKIKCKGRFINIDNKDDNIEVEYYGIASDTLDKDIYKAKTNGLKYLLTQQFLLVTDILIDAEEDKNEKSTTDNKTQPTVVKTPVTPNLSLGVCKDCGAPNVMSARTGRGYCSNKCWLNNKGPDLPMAPMNPNNPDFDIPF